MSRVRPQQSSGMYTSGQWTLTGLCLRDSRGIAVPRRAQNIARTFGTYKAARYLRSRGWSLEAALHYLATPKR